MDKFEATVTGYLTGSEDEKGIQFSLTVGNMCCSDHAAQEAKELAGAFLEQSPQMMIKWI